MTLPPCVRLSMTWWAWMVTTLVIAAPFARSGAATLEAAQAPVTTEAIVAMTLDLGPTDGDRGASSTGESLPAAADVARGPAPANTPLAREASTPRSEHMFGVLPNYTTVEEGAAAQRVTTRQTFQMAALSSLDPYVLPSVGIVAGVHPAAGQAYARRYGTALAAFLTTAVMPLALQQIRAISPPVAAASRDALRMRRAEASSPAADPGTRNSTDRKSAGTRWPPACRTCTPARRAHDHRHADALGHADDVGHAVERDERILAGHPP